MNTTTQLTQTFRAGGVRPVIALMWEAARRFGDIKQWRFYGGPNGARAYFYLKLHDPTRHQALADSLGGEVAGDEVCIPVDMPPEPHDEDASSERV